MRAPEVRRDKTGVARRRHRPPTTRLQTKDLMALISRTERRSRQIRENRQIGISPEIGNARDVESEQRVKSLIDPLILLPSD